MVDHLIEWIDHPTVAKDKVGKRSRMGETQATKQIASGRARLVEEEEPKVFASTSRGKKAKEETGAED